MTHSIADLILGAVCLGVAALIHRGDRVRAERRRRDLYVAKTSTANVIPIDLSPAMAAAAPTFTPLRNSVPRLASQGHDSVPVRQQAEPIVAWKRARIEVDVYEGRPALCGVVYGRYQPVDVARHCNGITGSATARSGLPDPHPAPRLDCHCGFHGVPKDRLIDAYVDYQTASCADLEVELYGTVIACERGWRAEKQRVLAVHLDLDCHQCYRPAVGVGFCGTTCGRCSPSLFSPADLASVWGVEVRWEEPPR